MSPPPRVTVLTPTYNQREQVGHCIRSVLGQSYPHWEQIVVDDGSDDGTPEYVERFGDPRIRCIRLPHRGLAALAETYNTGLRAARGELVAILEGDDAWPADKLERQLPTFEAPDVFLGWGSGLLIDERGRDFGRIRSAPAVGPRICLDRRELFARLVRDNVVVPAVTVMVRRSALLAIGGFRQTGSDLFVDLPTWLWLAACTPGRACYQDEVLGHYRVHRHQTTQRHRHRMDAQHLRAVLELERSLDPALLRELGWDARLRRSTLAGRGLVEATGLLYDGEFARARAGFSQALRHSESGPDRVRAAVGVVAASLRTNPFALARALRGRAAQIAYALRARHGGRR